MDELNIINWTAEAGKHHEAGDDESESPKIPQYCRNCGYEVPQRYCTYCGQSSRDIRTSFHSLILDFLGDYFTFDSKLFRSVLPIFLKPGFLTAAFMAGKRVRYIPPLRLYIFSSIIFFLTLTAITDPRSWFDKDSKNDQKETPVVVAPIKSSDPLKKDNGTTDQTTAIKKGPDAKLRAEGTQPNGEPEQTATLDSPRSERAEESKKGSEPIKPADIEKDVEKKKKTNIQIMEGTFDDHTWWGHWLNQHIKAQEEKLEAMEQTDLVSAFILTLIRNVPKALFLLMPLFAFFLKLLYFRRDPLYIDHLIFAFHFHAFLFLFYSLLIWVSLITPISGILFFGVGVLIISPAYLFFALRRVYHQGWIKTFIKFNLLSFLYFTSLNIIVLIVSIATIFMI